jgi:hypothetical protein
MKTALIGHSGFVGTSLARQYSFGAHYRSTNIGEIDNKSFDLVVCAAASAQKWIANKAPEADLARIGALIDHLNKMKCHKFVLISTVDVFKEPVEVNERSPVSETGLQPYGLNRRHLEKFVESRFEDPLIIRLPGLIGPGLRKNVIYDLLHDNNLAAVDSRSVYQFYPMVNLWYDIRRAFELGIKLLHLTAEPVSVARLAAEGFGVTFERVLSRPPVRYDFRTIYSSEFGGAPWYQYRLRETIQAIRTYAQSEPRTPKQTEPAS